jgi:hypothetical protein
MAASIIEQSPYPYSVLTPVGQDLIFVVSNQTAVANETRVKFVAEVYIGTAARLTHQQTLLLVLIKPHLTMLE